MVKFVIAVPCHYPLDLFERLRAIDTVEWLGIDRHFKEEIKKALDYVYRYHVFRHSKRFSRSFLITSLILPEIYYLQN